MRRLPPLNALRAFSVAARCGSMSKAGEALHVTQGAISRQVKLLEETLGRPLFLRVPHGLKLTEAGALLAEHLGQAFDGIERVVEQLAGDQRRSHLRINVPPTFATRWLAPRLTDFRRRHPFVDLQITTHWLQTPGERQGQDCLVTFDRVAESVGDREPLLQERHVMVASPALWQGSLPPTLGGQTLLHVLNGAERLPVWERWIERYCLDHIDPRPGMEFSTLDQAIHAAVSGAGVAIVDEAMIRPELSSGLLRLCSQLHMDGAYGYSFTSLARRGDRGEIIGWFRDWLFQQASPAETA